MKKISFLFLVVVLLVCVGYGVVVTAKKALALSIAPNVSTTVAIKNFFPPKAKVVIDRELYLSTSFIVVTPDEIFRLAEKNKTIQLLCYYFTDNHRMIYFLCRGDEYFYRATERKNYWDCKQDDLIKLMNDPNLTINGVSADGENLILTFNRMSPGLFWFFLFLEGCLAYSIITRGRKLYLRL